MCICICICICVYVYVYVYTHCSPQCQRPPMNKLTKQLITHFCLILTSFARKESRTHFIIPAIIFSLSQSGLPHMSGSAVLATIDSLQIAHIGSAFLLLQLVALVTSNTSHEKCLKGEDHPTRDRTQSIEISSKHGDLR